MRLSPDHLIERIRARSTEAIDREHLETAIRSGRRLRVKLGIDPTSPHLHLGHLVPVRMLRDFQDAGHTAVLIIGDFTGRVGDPSGRSVSRSQLTSAEVKRNERTYRRQIGRVLDMRRAEIRHNSEWFAKMRLEKFLSLLAQFSLRSLVDREDFAKRLSAGREVRFHEATYAVLQGYDSVAARADVELGAVDQKLNVLSGRDLQRASNLDPQDIILLPYLIGLDGSQKMSKSLGNAIHLDDSAADMFGKAMSIPDGLIGNYARLAAWLPEDIAKGMEQRIAGGVNPRSEKLNLAVAIVAQFYGPAVATRARKDFEDLFSRHGVPASLPETRLVAGAYHPLDLILKLKAAASRSEARRLLQGGALEINGSTISGDTGSISIKAGTVIRVGKKKFFRIG